MKLFTYLSFLICLILIAIIIYTKKEENILLQSSQTCKNSPILEYKKVNLIDDLIIEQCNKNNK